MKMNVEIPSGLEPIERSFLRKDQRKTLGSNGKIQKRDIQ